MKILLIMNQNSYPGREYLYALYKANIEVDVVEVGTYAEVNELEKVRCGGLWQPVKVVELQQFFRFHYFEGLKSEAFLFFLTTNKYTLGLQGGTGIISQNIIEQFELGILNFHPGDLPSYRGCSAPEWQLYENKPIISSCHLIDNGIDTGKIVRKKVLPTNSSSYEAFRASIYPQTASFLVDMIKNILINPSLIAQAKTQDEKFSTYRKVMQKENLNELYLKFNWPKFAYPSNG